MTREDRLYAMTGATLIQVADKLGVKVSCNKTRTALKEAKANVIERILAAEKAAEEAETAEIMQAKVDAGVEIMKIKSEEVQIVEEVVEEVKPAKKTRKRGKRVNNSETVASIVSFVLDNVNARDNVSVGIPSSEEMKFRALRINGRQFCKLMWSAKNVRLYFRCDVSDISGVEKVNYALPYLYIVDTFTEESKDIVNTLFNRAVEFEVGRKRK